MLLLAPKLIVPGCALLFILAGMVRRDWATRAAALVSLLAMAAAALLNLQYWPGGGNFFGDWLVVDELSRFVDLAVFVAAALVTLGSFSSERGSLVESDYFALLFFSLCGAVVLSSAANLVGVFLGVELATLPAFALVAGGDRKRGREAAVKYFITAVFASAFMVYGFSLVYGAAGTMRLDMLLRVPTSGLLVVGVAFALVGFGLKLTLFPFHFWVPDAFEAARPEVAAYLAVVPKIAGVAALIRVVETLSRQKPEIGVAMMVVAAATMTFGNLAALKQTNIKRMLAYSAIAHAGYAVVGIAVGTAFAMRASAAYFALYGLGAVGAFLVVAAASRAGIGETIEDYSGLSDRSPLLAAAMTIFMFSLVGIPLFAGFYGKLLVFAGAVKAGVLWLAIVGLVNGALSFGYYGRVIQRMYLVRADGPKPVRIDLPVGLAIAAAALGVIAVGVAPGILTAFLR